MSQQNFRQPEAASASAGAFQTELHHEGSANTQFLTFHLADGHYGIDILHVREIRAWSPVVPLPGSPAYLKGIMNLRGAIIPVIDLRMRLGLPTLEKQSRFAVTIVTRSAGKNIGLIADGVNEVITVPRDSVQKPPSAAERGDERFIQGVVLRASAQSDAAAAGAMHHASAMHEYAGANGSSSASAQAASEMIVVLDLDRLYDPSLEALAGDRASIAARAALHLPQGAEATGAFPSSAATDSVAALARGIQHENRTAPVAELTPGIHP